MLIFHQQTKFFLQKNKKILQNQFSWENNKHHDDPLDELSRLSILLGGVGGHPAETTKWPSTLNFISHPHSTLSLSRSLGLSSDLPNKQVRLSLLYVVCEPLFSVLFSVSANMLTLSLCNITYVSAVCCLSRRSVAPCFFLVSFFLSFLFPPLSTSPKPELRVVVVSWFSEGRTRRPL